MKKLTIKKINKLPTHPIFEGLPDKLKRPSSYEFIEKNIAKIMQTDHKHSTVKEYVTCAWCNKKRELKTNYILSKGFKDVKQYMMWKKVMELVINKPVMELYEKTKDNKSENN